jgi:hypothetical protein
MGRAIPKTASRRLICTIRRGRKSYKTYKLKEKKSEENTESKSEVKEEIGPKNEPISSGKDLAASSDAKAEVLDKIDSAKAKLPADHHITPGQKKKLDAIASALKTGDAKSILNHGYPTHTYGKQAAKLANEALAAMGSKHSVTPGQKMGEHAALKDDDASAAEHKPEPAAAPTAEAKPAEPEGPKEGDTKEGADGTLVLKDGHWVKQGDDQPVAVSGALTMPEFAPNKSGETKFAEHYTKVAQKIKEHAEAGNVQVLEDMKADGLTPKNGKVGNTWKGKTANSKALMAFYDAALTHAKGESPAAAAPTMESAPDSIPSPDKEIPKAVTDTLLAHPEGMSPKTWDEVAKYAANGDTKGLKDYDATKDGYPAIQEWIGNVLEAMGKKASEPVVPADLPVAFSYAAKTIKGWADEGNLVELEKMAAVHITEGAEDVGKLKDYAAALYEWKTGKKVAGETPMPEGQDIDVGLKEDADTALEEGDMQTLKDIAAYAKKEGMHATEFYASKHIGELNAKHAEAAVPTAAGAKPVKPILSSSVSQEIANKIEKELNAGNMQGLLDQQTMVGTGQPAPTNFGKLEQYAKEAIAHLMAKNKASWATPNVVSAAEPVKPEGSKFTGAVNGIEQAYKDSDLNAEVLQNWAKFDAHGDADFQVVVDYAKQVTQALGGKVGEGGPQEGDTKEGADGMLVLRNGHWVKMGGDEKPTGPSAAEAVAKLKVPKMTGKNSVKLKNIIKEMHISAVSGGAEGLGKMLSITPDGKVKVTGLIALSTTAQTHGENALAFAQYAKQLHDAVIGTGAVGSEVAEPKPKAKKVVGSTVTTSGSIDGWTQVGPQGGYNPGGTYEDLTGQKWYVKFPSGGEKVVKNELLATKLYALAGVEVPEVKLVNQGGKIGLASKIVDGAVANKSALLEGKAKGLLQGFGADAWLANWDTVGNNPAAGKGFDNILIKPDGSAVRIDAGGALLYGGAGGKKQKFEDDVIELKTMLDPAKNPNTAAVFSKMSQADIAASVAKVAAISDAHIESLVQTYGPGSQAEKDRLAAKLIARKENMIAQYPSAAKAAAAKTTKSKSGKTIDPTDTSWVSLKPGQKITEHGVSQWGVQFAKVENPPSGFNADKLPQPYPYTASKSAHVNAANTADIQKLFDNAKAGKTAEAVENTQFEQISKETGEKSGKMLDIANHPSKVYLQEYATQLAAEVKAQTSPTYEMQTRGSATGSYSDIAKRIASKVKTIAYEQFQGWKDKAADYMVLNKTEADGIPKPEPGMFHDMEKGTKEFNDFKKASDNNYNKLTGDEKSACQAYTGAAYRKWNEALRMGQVDSEHFAGSADMRAAFAKAAVELPEGIILHRGIGVGGDTYKSVIGAVIQDGSFQSSSFGGTAAFSGKESQLRLHVTKGVKAMMAATFSSHSEREIILHPNTRYVVMGVKYENGQNHVDVLVLPHEE